MSEEIEYELVSSVGSILVKMISKDVFLTDFEKQNGWKDPVKERLFLDRGYEEYYELFEALLNVPKLIVEAEKVPSYLEGAGEKKISVFRLVEHYRTMGEIPALELIYLGDFEVVITHRIAELLVSGRDRIEELVREGIRLGNKNIRVYE